MKVILDHPNPFQFAHGGFQVQIEQTYAGLREAQVQAEYLRWWDDQQSADVIHYFGRPPVSYIEQAHKKGIRIVLAQLLTAVGSRSPRILPFQKAAIALAEKSLPKLVTYPFAWDAFRKSDACVAGTPWEAHLMSYIFGAPKERVHVVKNGVEKVFFQSKKTDRGPWLVCSATITERKRVVELAEAALAAQTPIWVIGKPYSGSDPYAERFLSMARQNPEMIRYEGAISDRAQLASAYREARGFVLLSTMESLSLSSAEAAACECPLLLSDLPWARTTYHDSVSYCPIVSPAQTARYLRNFYDAAPRLQPPPTPPTWLEIGNQFKAVYEQAINRR
jgi:glycosyltransferase involved in cell wall biosynthesis